ncbi:hypothetical protein ACRRTK_019396 [Alexandromys fortis]
MVSKMQLALRRRHKTSRQVANESQDDHLSLCAQDVQFQGSPPHISESPCAERCTKSSVISVEQSATSSLTSQPIAKNLFQGRGSLSMLPGTPSHLPAGEVRRTVRGRTSELLPAHIDEVIRTCCCHMARRLLGGYNGQEARVEEKTFCHVSKHIPPEVHPPADLELGRFRTGPPSDTSAGLQRSENA